MLSWKIQLSLLFVVCFASGLTDFCKSSLDTPTGTLTFRALPNAPNGYTPEDVQCPSPNPSVRIATNISEDEMNWLQKRQDKRLKAMETFLTRMKIPNFNATQYFAKTQATSLPNIGISFSGGGYRALLNGAGAFAAFDERTSKSTAPGQLGGLLQSTTYISGLSGGSWLVGSIYTNNFTTVTALLNSNASGVWEFDQSILSGPTGDAGYFRQLRQTVDGKEEAGFSISITDYWYETTHLTLKILHMIGNVLSHILRDGINDSLARGRGLSYQLVNASEGGPAYTWSSIASTREFLDGKLPMPIITALERAPSEQNLTIIKHRTALNSSIYEFNPWELGTWDPTTYGFMPLGVLGSNFTNGNLSKDDCISGFDNVGFIMGTSSSLFNQALLQINNTDIQRTLKSLTTSLLQNLNDSSNDVSVYEPNPFFGFNEASNRNAQAKALILVDGGEDLQNIPFYPLLQANRKVDIIFAIDSSADTPTRWPNGTSMVATYQRNSNSSKIANGTAFPSIPDQNTFINLGLNGGPVFFGCDPSNSTGKSPAPLIVYIPNNPYTYMSNISTLTLELNDTERDKLVLNGYNVATMGNSTAWGICIGCAIVSRSLHRTDTSVPSACVNCFNQYCWNGTVNATTPKIYEPRQKIQ
ncbi:lysophospholipase catalytic domain-containing protein [Penicillium subrubescens]|uniref:lysophospholipase catalytic domain-containing protein n=1 Tax=Penicillium subrubescens TaxID=1316194 RepID=UPI0025455CB3|nr:lysophospholipase catalytic domain-containing protein [Penicillium subrubescens]KAJ5884083.1 lysophospholipase catalytic domain-containing protein [Penicillium subrubescens]